MKRGTRKRKPNGFIAWEGKSSFDGSPIVVIVTGIARKSKNPKTGNLLQTWILRADINPATACKEGKDFSVCYRCPLRGKGCYVNSGQAPYMIFEAYKRGSYPQASDIDLKKVTDGRSLRIGSYGDPAACPKSVWDKLISLTKKYVGYTHAWQYKEARELCGVLQASVENATLAEEAQGKGWHTFRIFDGEANCSKGETKCNAQTKGVSCDKCMKCNGSKNVAVRLHGPKYIVARYRKAQAV